MRLHLVATMTQPQTTTKKLRHCSTSEPKKIQFSILNKKTVLLPNIFSHSHLASLRVWVNIRQYYSANRMVSTAKDLWGLPPNLCILIAPA
jgi:hypothetical protein